MKKLLLISSLSVLAAPVLAAGLGANIACEDNKFTTNISLNGLESCDVTETLDIDGAITSDSFTVTEDMVSEIDLDAGAAASLVIKVRCSSVNGGTAAAATQSASTVDGCSVSNAPAASSISLIRSMIRSQVEREDASTSLDVPSSGVISVGSSNKEVIKITNSASSSSTSTAGGSAPAVGSASVMSSSTKETVVIGSSSSDSQYSEQSGAGQPSNTSFTQGSTSVGSATASSAGASTVTEGNAKAKAVVGTQPAQ